MANLIEEMARKIYESFCRDHDPSFDPVNGSNEWPAWSIDHSVENNEINQLTEWQRDEYRGFARAAIEALPFTIQLQDYLKGGYLVPLVIAVQKFAKELDEINKASGG